MLQAIDALLHGGPVRVDAAGSEEASANTTLTGVLDRAAGKGRWTETTPSASSTDVIAETVVNGGSLYSRIYFSNESLRPFARIIDPVAARQALDGAFTVAGKLTDSLDRVRRMVAEIPFDSTTLSAAAHRQADGVNVRFRTDDVYDWLVSTGLETVDGPRPAAGTTTMQLWISAGVLVGFGARDDDFQDGELLHNVTFDVTYKPVEQRTVTTLIGGFS